MKNVSRRGFLQIAGMSAAAILAACGPQTMPTAIPAPDAKAAADKAPTSAAAMKAPIKIQVSDRIADDATGPTVFRRIKYEEFAETFPQYEVEHIANPDVGFEKRKEYWLTAYSPGGPNAMMGDSTSGRGSLLPWARR